ncbi:uncharacterized protein BDR25DRAFT_284625 [Lindgomyces ingoldianus]|uniref:Uncharacterized protein n=1 Tax=Lindgomyces ingoldianus TaxID=673940 RepID=A0ACB6QZ16_9PLEO|nr:uncharacterized protein BDR25DRAFT_284625 [Lindgomyces ingoldianus]KAF2472136.1 hypothetical protein BDR25DRAFT_284625 [Lindgomyces ingoldianus]
MESSSTALERIESEERTHKHANIPPPTWESHEPLEIIAELNSADKSEEKESSGLAETGASGVSKARRRWKPKFSKASQETNSEFEHKSNYVGNPTILLQLRIIFINWINILLPLIPAGFAVNYTHQNAVIVFCINFVAIIPSAFALGFATEELSMRVGEKMGALLNMTFGNAIQLITSILLLKTRQIDVLKSSLLGSILSNLLLTTGLSFFLGGLNRIQQYFNVTLALTVGMLLLLAVLSLLIPTASKLMNDNITTDDIAAQSRGTSFVLLFSYALWLVFQLRTHNEVFNEPSQKVPKKKPTKVEEGQVIRGLAQMGGATAASSGGGIHGARLVRTRAEEEEEPDEVEVPSLSLLGAIFTLTISVVLIAFNTQFATDSIQGLLQHRHISQTFLGLVILPLLSIDPTSIAVAIKDKMDISIALTLERCMQTALMIVPLIVLLAWCMGIADMNLQFDGFSIAALFASILIVTYMVQEGKSNWLEGALLINVFVIISVAAFFIR